MYERAWNYARERLARELSPELHYHNLWHTESDVVPATAALADELGVAGDDRMLLLTAAWFHDIGFVVQRQEHEAAGAHIARAILPDFGFATAEIEAICGMIMATKLPQSPHNLLEEIVADADLDVLGREADFLPRNLALRTEMQYTAAQPLMDRQWFGGQRRFLQSHMYWTPAAQQRRNTGKQQNIVQLGTLLAACEQREVGS